MAEPIKAAPAETTGATPVLGEKPQVGKWLAVRSRHLDVPVVAVRVAFVSNTSTWTYLGSRAVHTNPGASFATGLGLFAMQSLGLPTVAHVLHEILRSDGDPRGRHVVRHDAVPLVRVSCEAPVAWSSSSARMTRGSSIPERTSAFAGSSTPTSPPIGEGRRRPPTCRLRW